MSAIVISNYVALNNGRENSNRMKTKLPFSCFPQLQRCGSQFSWFSAGLYGTVQLVQCRPVRHRTIYMRIILVSDFSKSIAVSCVILCLSHERSVNKVNGLVTQVDTSIVNFIFCSQQPLGFYEITT
jgi:hypothetical protein